MFVSRNYISSKTSKPEKALLAASAILGIALVALGITTFFAVRGGLPPFLIPLKQLAILQSKGAIAFMSAGAFLAAGPIIRMLQLALVQQKEKKPLWITKIPVDDYSLDDAVKQAQNACQKINDTDLQKDFLGIIDALSKKTRELIKNAKDPSEKERVFNEAQTELSSLCDVIPQLTEAPASLPIDAQQWGVAIKTTLISGNLEEFKHLLEEGKKQNFLNQKILIFGGGSLLVQLGKLDRHIPFMKELLAYTKDLSIVDDAFGDTALHWAIANASNEMALYILEECGKGSYLDIQCNEGNTALHLAVGKGYKDKNNDGKPLKVSNLQLVKKLIESRANLNLKNQDGNTPLHLAYLRCDEEMIQALIEAGANPDLKNNENILPSQMKNLSYEETCDLLHKTVVIFEKNSFFSKKQPSFFSKKQPLDS